MEKKLRETIRIIASAVQEILEFWLALFGRAAIVALIVLLSVMGFAIVFEIITRLVSPYFGVNIPSLFTAPYLIAICSVYIPIFLYLLLYYSAHKYKDIDLIANKLNWKDVKITLLPLRKDDIASLALVIKNKKPFNLEKVKANLVYQEVAKEDRTHANSWQLGWLNDRKFSWEEKDIESDKEGRLALLSAYFWKDAVDVFIPGPDGQPKDRKSIGGFGTADKFLIIDLRLSAYVSGSVMEVNTVRVKAEIIGDDVYVKLNDDYFSKKIKVLDNG